MNERIEENTEIQYFKKMKGCCVITGIGDECAITDVSSHAGLQSNSTAPPSLPTNIAWKEQQKMYEGFFSNLAQ